MDFVNRLKFFMDKENITSSQFADSCRIPRPTMSQILNGRNKKISDELIAKIHAAYPRLSVLWLMFGEGDMAINSNTQISEAQNGSFEGEIRPQPTAEQTIDKTNSSNTEVRVFGPENSELTKSLFDEANSTSIPYQRPDEHTSQTDSLNERQQFYMHTHELIEFDDSPDQPAATTKSKLADATPAATSNSAPTPVSQTKEDGKRNISITTAANKRITNIVVFYSDNSFQSFNPS